MGVSSYSIYARLGNSTVRPRSWFLSSFSPAESVDGISFRSIIKPNKAQKLHRNKKYYRLGQLSGNKQERTKKSDWVHESEIFLGYPFFSFSCPCLFINVTISMINIQNDGSTIVSSFMEPRAFSEFIYRKWKNVNWACFREISMNNSLFPVSTVLSCLFFRVQVPETAFSHGFAVRVVLKHFS